MLGLGMAAAAISAIAIGPCFIVALRRNNGVCDFVADGPFLRNFLLAELGLFDAFLFGRPLDNFNEPASRST